MLVELHIRDLGVIVDLRLDVEPGMTAVTGETGAGKTMIVEALDLLLGGRADPVLVRPGASEALVEGRFTDGDDDVVLTRVVPASGRSRAYVNGRMAPVSALAEAGVSLVDLHGQHAHQALLSATAQRAALDAFGSVDLAPVAEAVAALRSIDSQLAALGGDPRARAREIDLLRFQVREVETAGITDLDEEAALEIEEERLADVVAHREAATLAHAALTDDGGAADAVGIAIGALAGRAPFADLEARLRAVAAEVAELTSDVRATGEGLEEDPARLAEVRARRQLLRDLCRKYGATLTDVVAFGHDAAARLDELQSHDVRAARLDQERARALESLRSAEAVVGSARRAAAPRLEKEIEAHLRTLAMPKARFVVDVPDEDPGDRVVFRISANPGEPPLPLAKVASGGELARTMLAARLVLTGGADTIVFDEVDAGVGGEAAVAVGRALAVLARRHQVLVVTHLPQVAAFADRQIVVRKDERDGRTVASAEALDGGERVVELSRMLSGQPSSATARGHAEELLASAAQERPR
jgi:DNA repair protein RecN (Recombination protein N)